MNKKILWVSVSLFALNFILKLSFADTSISGDEAFSIFFSQQDLSSLIERLSKDQNPPLYFIILHFWIKLFGISEIATRSLSVLFSSLCSAGIYLTGRKLISNNTGIIAALLFSFLLPITYYAQEVRSFSLVLLLAIIAIYSFSSYFFDEKKRKYLILLTASSALLVYTHFLTVTLLLSLFVFALVYTRKKLSSFLPYLVSQIIAALFFLPWLGYLYQNLPEDGVFWLAKPGISNLIQEMFNLVGGKIPFALGAISLGLLLYTQFKKPIIKTDIQLGKLYFFIVVWLLPPLLTFLISQVTPAFLYRYFLFSSLGFILFVSSIVLQVKSKYQKVLSIALVFFAVFKSSDFAPAKEENWKDVVEYAQKKLANDDMILISEYYKSREFSYYYNQPVFCDYINYDEKLKANNIIAFSSPDIANIAPSTTGAKQVLVVLSHIQNSVAEQNIIEVLNKQSTLIESKEFAGVKTYLFE